jgi:hypothetical protein
MHLAHTKQSTRSLLSPQAKTAHDRDLIQRQIDATDQQIDALVSCTG